MVDARSDEGTTRRRFLGYAAATVAGTMVPARALGVARAAAGCVAPAGFPADVPLGKGAWSNWSEEIVVEDLWTAVPRTADDVVRVVNWASANGWRVRARGHMHGWSPLGVLPRSSCADRLILVDTTQHLTAVQVTSPDEVVAEAGATMDQILGLLEAHGLGITAVPAPGDITIGGALAIDAHGAAIPAAGESRTAGHTFGSLSNLVLSLTVVAWDRHAQRYALRTFDRDHPYCKAFLTHLGRSFVTSVRLRTGANVNLRCVSTTDVAAADLFAPAASAGPNSFASYLDEAGRVEAIWFPFTAKPWLKTWTVTPERPAGSTTVTGPYNYAFSDHLPTQVSDLARSVVTGNGSLTPLLGQLQYDVSVAGLTASGTHDLWGKAKNLQLYIRPTTLRVTANGYAVITSRSQIQRVVSEFSARYLRLVADYQARGSFPANGPVEIRATGLDHRTDVGVHGAQSPALSALAPRHDQPSWDVAIWFDVLTFPGTPVAAQFMTDLEQWFFTNYRGYAAVRPEWSKGWAYSAAGAWTSRRVLRHTIREAYTRGHQPGAGFEWARRTLNHHDPHRVFSNDFLDVLLP